MRRICRKRACARTSARARSSVATHAACARARAQCAQLSLDTRAHHARCTPRRCVRRLIGLREALYARGGGGGGGDGVVRDGSVREWMGKPSAGLREEELAREGLVRARGLRVTLTIWRQIERAVACVSHRRAQSAVHDDPVWRPSVSPSPSTRPPPMMAAPAAPPAPAIISSATDLGSKRAACERAHELGERNSSLAVPYTHLLLYIQEKATNYVCRPSSIGRAQD